MIKIGKNRRSRCTGSVTHEVTMTIVLATAVMLGVAQIAAMVSQQRRMLDHRAVASREAGNLMEDLMSRPWGEVTADAGGSLQLSQSCQTRLPNAQLQIEVAAEDETVAKRITIAIHWPSIGGRPAAPVQIVAWRYPPQEVLP